MPKLWSGMGHITTEGLWEAAVKSCKTLLRSANGQQVLIFEEFYTVHTMVDTCLNSSQRRSCLDTRSLPNCFNPPISSFFREYPGASCWACPSSGLETGSINDSFLERWCSNAQSGRMIPNLSKSLIWYSSKKTRATPIQWSRGRILDVYTGNYGVPPVARLKTPSAIYNRPDTRLIRLLFNDGDIVKSDHWNCSSIIWFFMTSGITPYFIRSIVEFPELVKIQARTRQVFGRYTTHRYFYFYLTNFQDQ